MGLDFSHIVFIAGNHDRKFESHGEQARKVISSRTSNGGEIYYLQDSGCEIDGVKFYGSPWQPEFCSWAFNLPRGSKLKEKWDKIPEGTDVLITHCPPYRILDRTHYAYGEEIGCEDLLDTVLKVRPKLHVFGHCHAGYGMNYHLLDGTVFVNASTCSEQYNPINPPVEFDI